MFIDSGVFCWYLMGFDRHSAKDASMGLACYQDVLLFTQLIEE